MSTGASPEAPIVAPPAAPGAELGVEVIALRRSAAGYMLDLRYRITDPNRAGAFLDPEAERFLIDQATGARLRVPSAPKVGALRQTPQAPDPQRVYFTLFANPGRRIQAGDRLTLAVGDLRAADLVVE